MLVEGQDADCKYHVPSEQTLADQWRIDRLKELRNIVSYGNLWLADQICHNQAKHKIN